MEQAVMTEGHLTLGQELLCSRPDFVEVSHGCAGEPG